jgi:transcriptional regulator with XRE-family HTH domain
MGQPKRKTTIRASGKLPSSRPPLEATPRAALIGNSGNGKKTVQGGEIFGRLVAVRRAARGLSQEDLAAMMDTSQSNVARIEEGQPPSSETLKRLAAALDVEPATGGLRRSVARATASGDRARTLRRAGVSLGVTIVAALWLSMIVVDGGGARIGLATAAVAALWLSVIVAERGARTGIAAGPNVQRGKAAPQRPIARAAASGSGARTPWNALGGRWLWGGPAIAVVVPVLVILGGRSSSTDGGDPSQQSLQAGSAAPAAPITVVEAQKKAQKTERVQKTERGQKTKEEGGRPVTTEPTAPSADSTRPGGRKLEPTNAATPVRAPTLSPPHTPTGEHPTPPGDHTPSPTQPTDPTPPTQPTPPTKPIHPIHPPHPPHP